MHVEDDGLGVRIAEAPHAVGRAQLERTVLDAGERALEHAPGDRSERSGSGAHGDDGLSLDAAHVGIDPRSGSNGGLRWNGTRLRHSCSACQWMRAMTCAGHPGIAHERVRERARS